MTPTTSVIIPAFGESPYLQQALVSVLQDVPVDCQVILVDDGLEANSRNIALELCRIYGNLHLVKNKGIGLVAALNTGIDSSESELIFRMDSDDVWLLGRFESQLGQMQRDPNLAVCGGQICIMRANGTQSLSNYPLTHEEILVQLKAGSPFAHPATLIRRRFLIQAGEYRRTFVKGRQSLIEDYDLWMRLSMIPEARFLNLKIEVLQYREHENQVSAHNRAEQSLATFLLQLFFRNPELINDNLGNFPIDIGVDSFNLEKFVKVIDGKSKNDLLKTLWNQIQVKNYFHKVTNFFTKKEFKITLWDKSRFVVWLLVSKLRAK